MRLIAQLAAASVIAQAAFGLQCSKDSILEKYNVDKYSISHQNIRATPPSSTTEDWWINICQENPDEAPEGCQKDDVLCGTTKVTLKDEPDKPILTQLIDFPESVSSAASENSNGDLVVDFKDVKWGSYLIDAQITFVCAANKNPNVVTSLAWRDKKVEMVVEGDAGCLKKKDDKDNDSKKEPKPDKKKGTSIGSWFLWLITYALLFALIYLLATSYMSTRGGSLREFREEFVDRSSSLASSLPQFTKEVVSRVLGRSSSSSSQRGGYSAV
ncbi:LAFA_0G03972g1_1 [Lachancea sp. 'fantastica']|nr:LAFA_0G03972g1_1 [Lachancea sp. 'fantastica']